MSVTSSAFHWELQGVQSINEESQVEAYLNEHDGNISLGTVGSEFRDILWQILSFTVDVVDSLFINDCLRTRHLLLALANLKLSAAAIELGNMR